MQTRVPYLSASTLKKRTRAHKFVTNSKGQSKKLRLNAPDATRIDPFQSLPDDLLIGILVSVSSTAPSSADLANTMLTCRRFYCLSFNSWVLARAGIGTLAVNASRWSDGAHRFLKRCADVGNVEACYILGIIEFYCLRNRSGGACFMAKAALASHAGALHSLAVIQFNGSGGMSKRDKNLKAGVALCARAALLGQVDAMRDLGHCLQDGYGVARNVAEGRRLLLEANAREAAAAGFSPPNACPETARRGSGFHGQGIACSNLQNHDHLKKNLLVISHPSPQNHHEEDRTCCSLLSDFGCINVPTEEPHIANKFLVEWFSLHPLSPGLRLCSFNHCGRPETRRHEFRRCSACGSVNYCSRACQALHWKICHRYHCTPSVEDWEYMHEIDAHVEEDQDHPFHDLEEFRLP